MYVFLRNFDPATSEVVGNQDQRTMVSIAICNPQALNEFRSNYFRKGGSYNQLQSVLPCDVSIHFDRTTTVDVMVFRGFHVSIQLLASSR